MSKYTVNSVDIPELPGWHKGTGRHQTDSWGMCDINSPGMNLETPLFFLKMQGTIHALCFDLSEPLVPRRFAVAVRDGAGVEAFTRVNIFFHPNPAHAGMTDATYPSGGLWPRLYRYMNRLGTGMAAAGNKMVLIMPYMKASSSYNACILSTDWHDVILAVLKAAKAKLLPCDSTNVAINQVIVSSYCYGIRYSDTFRRRAGKSLHDVLHSVWDFDGLFSTEHSCSEQLHSSVYCKAIKYDQARVSSTGTNYHLPLSRWSALVPPPKTPKEVHDLIPAGLFFHACKNCGVG
jgi:hypothetical protein